MFMVNAIAELLGKGGHAEIYKGCLPDGQVVAVKKITKKDENLVGKFLTELGIIAHINHTNAAKLIGFSIENGLYLVLQFAPNGSLATLQHGSTESTMEWSIRFKVALRVADGLKYLHSDCQRRIIHRDITASNILLSEDHVPQAKWLPEKWVHHVVYLLLRAHLDIWLRNILCMELLMRRLMYFRTTAGNLARDAAGEADKALSINPKDTASLILKGLALDVIGHKSAALKCLDTALIPPAVKSLSEKERGEALFKRAELQLSVNRRRRVDSAVADLVEAVRLSGDNGKAYCLLGQCFVTKGMRNEAQKAFDTALKIEPDLKKYIRKNV